MGNVFGDASTAKSTEVPHFKTTDVKGYIREKGHPMMFHVVVELPIRTYLDTFSWPVPIQSAHQGNLR